MVQFLSLQHMKPMNSTSVNSEIRLSRSLWASWRLPGVPLASQSDAKVFKTSSMRNIGKRWLGLAVVCEAFPVASDHDEVRVCRRHTRTSQVPISSAVSLALLH